MKKFVKFIHFISLSIFLGSISSYILLGFFVEDEKQLLFSRSFVLFSTESMTIPAMWLLGLTGFAMSGIPQNLWKRIKVFGFILIAANTHVFIFPAIKNSNTALGEGNEMVFEQAMTTEAVAGFINLLLVILMIVVALFRSRLGWAQKTEKIAR